MIAYKILKSQNKNLVSCSVDLCDGGVRYRIGKKTKPKKNCGPLCCYRTLEEAKEHDFLGPVIYKCKVKESKEKYVWSLVLFVKTRLPVSEIGHVLYADEVTLLERVYP